MDTGFRRYDKTEGRLGELPDWDTRAKNLLKALGQSDGQHHNKTSRRRFEKWRARLAASSAERSTCSQDAASCWSPRVSAANPFGISRRRARSMARAFPPRRKIPKGLAAETR